MKYIESLSHNLNVSGEDTNEGLFAAVVKGDAGMTAFFIKKVADVNAKHGEPGSPRNTVLIEAVNGGSIEVVELLLDSGADINLLNRYHDTSLNAAAIKGDLDVFNYLILKGASFKNSDRQEKKILHNAASGGNLDIVKYLIKQGLSVDTIDGNNSTPLMHSAAHGKLDVTRFLLAEGADVNHVDSFSSSVLSKAIIKKKNTDKELLVLLLENGADVDKMLNYYQGEAKMTAVQFAKKYLNKELYRLIKSKSSFFKRMLNLWST